MVICSGPKDHVSRYRKLMLHFASAFERGSLPLFLGLTGVLDCIDTERTCRAKDVNNECTFCSRICSTFPLNCLLELYNDCFDSCLDSHRLFQLIRQRKWSAKCLEMSSSEFCSPKTVCLGRVAVNETYRKELIKRMAFDPNHIYFLSKVQLERIRFMVDIGIDIGTWGETPKDATKEHLLEQMEGFFPLSKWGFARTKSTFDTLVQLGYPFDESDFILVDELSDTLFKDLQFADKLHTMAWKEDS